MAEPTQYSFPLREVAELLIRTQGLHEGSWALSLQFSVSIGNFGVAPAEGKPGALIVVDSLQLVRQTNPQPGTPNVVDAAKVNPAPTTRKGKRVGRK
jgi:hypothetical protein